jgi:MFS family permease
MIRLDARGPTMRALAGFRGWRAFRHRNYRLFFGGQLISVVGTWMQQVAQGWLVLELTNEPVMLGLVAAAQFTPVLLLGLFGGLIADGLPKRRTLLTTQAVQMTLALVLFGLVVTGTVAVWHILVIAVLLGISNAFDMPTRQAFVVEMVGREDIGNAVALNSAMFNAARILGPAIAGLTIGAFSISIAFLVNGLSFLAVIIGLLVMRDDELRAAPQLSRPTSVRGALDNLGDGLRYVRRTEMVLLSLLVLGLVATFGMNFSVIVPALARDVLGTDASGYGFLMTASGVGSLIAALAIAFSGRTRPVLIAGGAVVLGLAEIVAGVSRLYPLSLVALLAVGLGGIAMAATINTTIQLTVPDRLRGRVMSVYTTVFAGSAPVGGLLMGGIASALGVDVSLWIGGLACVAIGAYAAVRLRALARGPSLAVEPGAGPEDAQRPEDAIGAPSSGRVVPAWERAGTEREPAEAGRRAG